MKLLILGGTRFLGRHLVTAASARNHQVTLFNRGNHPLPTSDPEIIHGDRNGDLSKLQGRCWDAVIDTCGYLPRNVKAVGTFLSDSVDRYVFISSQSAYADVSRPGVDENATLATLTSDQLREADLIDSSGVAVNYGKLYGGLKALSEQAAEEAFRNRLLVIRPGLLVGPDDYTDRFTYWVVRVAAGGEVLAPGRPDRMIQFIDVRDLAEWTVRMIERKETGTYNASGSPSALTMQQLLETAKVVSDSDASLTWVDEHFLLQEPVNAWSEMPLWLPEEAAPHLNGFMFINSEKAIASGLQYRPLRETIIDTLTWYQANRANQRLIAGIEREREQALLVKWHSLQER